MKSSLLAVCGASLLALLIVLTASRGRIVPAESARTPLRQWDSARSDYFARLPDKVVEKLRGDVDRDATLRERARVWRCILLAGMSRAYLELAVFFKEGARRNPGYSEPFRVQAQECHLLARKYAAELAALLNSRRTWLRSSESVILDFGMPDRASDSSLTLVSIANGYWPGAHQAAAAKQNALMRAILEQTMRVTGAKSAAELRQQLSSGPLTVPKARFLAALPSE
jgi:hypothetical protein